MVAAAKLRDFSLTNYALISQSILYRLYFVSVFVLILILCFMSRSFSSAIPFCFPYVLVGYADGILIAKCVNDVALFPVGVTAFKRVNCRCSVEVVFIVSWILCHVFLVTVVLAS